MPADQGAIVHGFGEKAGAPAQDVRPYDILDSVEDARMADHLVQPRKQQMWLAVGAGGNFAAFPLFQLGKFGTQLRDFTRRDRG